MGVAPDDRLALKPISVRRYGERDAEISDGVVEGDRIVVLGVQKLESGEKIRPTTQLDF
jgi:hypothetical protein